MRKLFFLIFTIPAILACRHIGSDTTRYSHEFEEEPALYEEFEFQDNGKTSSWHEDWSRASWTQNNTQMTIDRATIEDGFIHIRTTDYKEVDNSYTGSLTALGGSIQTRKSFLYGKWEARLKPASEAGVVNAFFIWNNQNLQEVDIEFTPYTFDSEKGTGEIHLAVHAEGHTNHFVEDVELDFNPSDDFHVYSIEIYSDKVIWTVDGNFLSEYIFDNEVKIDTEYIAIINGWSSKHAWVKGPPAQTAHYYIDWVKFYPLKEID